MKQIRYLENRLSKYENLEKFDLDKAKSNAHSESPIRNQTDNIFIDSEIEKHQKVVGKIGEGSTSIVYKVINEETGQVICKKVLKCNENITFKDAQNMIKEFEVLSKINFPSINKIIGINTQEKVNTDEIEHKEYSDDDYDDEQDEKAKKDELTTIALFTEYNPYKLKDMLEQNILTNTLKVKISIEIAFGMLHIHSQGMIHRDLKIDNVMLNYIFEAKIIDFGLVHDGSINNSLTKGVGTFDYMSPEISNEEDYDNKTDVYSYGVLPFVLFTGHLPKQSLKDKLTNKPIRFPRHSSSISSFCIELIKKCMSFESNNRPSFKEILDEMKTNSFKLASEIDIDTVTRRYNELNNF